MVTMIVGQVLSLIAVAITAFLLRRLTRLELSLACLLCGFVAGQLVEVVGFDTGIRAHNLEDLVFYLILPVLIFEAAWHIDIQIFRRWAAPALLLATVGVLVGTFVCAFLVYRGIAHPTGFPWIAALITGAILAATDPVSVIGQLRARSAPEDLTTLFEGESLFNDASAVVLFSLMLSMALGPQGGELNPFLSFLLVFFGGLGVGLLSGLLTTAVVRALNASATGTIVLLFSAFGTFYLAEHILHVSGIMAVLAASLLARGLLRGSEVAVERQFEQTLEWAGEMFNSLLFVIMGLVITLGMFESHWLAMLIAIAAALLARVCAVGVCGLLLWPLPQRIPPGWQVLLVWGGLRGAIALALVLSLPVELDYWYTIQCMVFGVVLFSMLVQGTTNGLLIRRFGTSQQRGTSG